VRRLTALLGREVFTLRNKLCEVESAMIRSIMADDDSG
jgi:hypothetical protein